MSRDEIACDVLIVGGGLVGSVLAHALAPLPLSIVLVEARDPRVLAQPSFDERATALANGSRRILAGLGLWDDLARHAQAIDSIHISEQGQFGAARISASEERVAALGYTVENRIIGRAVWDALAGAANVDCLAPARLLSIEERDGGLLALLDPGDRPAVRARLLLAADGAQSRVRAALGIAAREDHYRQRALILNCRTEHAHRGRAFERFTAGGPLALLPLSDGRVAVVWTCAETDADRLITLDEPAFRCHLQAAFGYRLGRITRSGARSAHRLARVRSAVLGGRRAVLIGNAAVSLHPVAGQGFNLALRDVATLADVLAGALSVAPDVDIGAPAVLERYRAARTADQRSVALFTHGLIRLFGAGAPGLAALRGLGLAAFDVLPGAKTVLARRMMGLAGRLSSLARGLPAGTT